MEIVVIEKSQESKKEKQNNKENIKTEWTTVRWTRDEKAVIERLATDRGESVTNYIRDAVITAARIYIDTANGKRRVKRLDANKVKPLIADASDQYEHRVAAPIVTTSNNTAAILIDIYRSLQAIGGTVREIYLTLKSAGNYDPDIPDNVNNFDHLFKAFRSVQEDIERYLSLPPAPPMEIIPPQPPVKRKSPVANEAREMRATMDRDDHDDDSIKDDI